MKPNSLDQAPPGDTRNLAYLPASLRYSGFVVGFACAIQALSHVLYDLPRFVFFTRLSESAHVAIAPVAIVDPASGLIIPPLLALRLSAVGVALLILISEFPRYQTRSLVNYRAFVKWTRNLPREGVSSVLPFLSIWTLLVFGVEQILDTISMLSKLNGIPVVYFEFCSLVHNYVGSNTMAWVIIYAMFAPIAHWLLFYVLRLDARRQLGRELFLRLKLMPGKNPAKPSMDMVRHCGFTVSCVCIGLVISYALHRFSIDIVTHGKSNYSALKDLHDALGFWVDSELSQNFMLMIGIPLLSLPARIPIGQVEALKSYRSFLAWMWGITGEGPARKFLALLRLVPLWIALIWIGFDLLVAISNISLALQGPELYWGVYRLVMEFVDPYVVNSRDVARWIVIILMALPAQWMLFRLLRLDYDRQISPLGLFSKRQGLSEPGEGAPAGPRLGERV